jgi:hypothetical protein
VSLESSTYTYIFGFLTVILLNWWSLMFLPIVVMISKSIVHRCGKCHFKLETLNPFNLPSLKDEVMTLKCGECIVVISRTYFYVVGAILLVGVIYLKLDAWANAEPRIEVIKKIPATWDEYVNDCGMDVL